MIIIIVVVDIVIIFFFIVFFFFFFVFFFSSAIRESTQPRYLDHPPIPKRKGMAYKQWGGSVCFKIMNVINCNEMFHGPH